MEKLSGFMSKYGKRQDGSSYKQEGYLGELPLSNGNIATEYSVGVNIEGQEIDIPTITPNLTQSEILQVLNAAKLGKLPSDEIIGRAIEHAKQRIKMGRSPFWSIPEKQFRLSDLIK